VITSYGRATRFVVVCIALVGCDSGDVSLDCASSLSTYCSAHGCATSIDPQRPISSFCDNQTAIDQFGVTGPCPSNGEVVIDVRKSDSVSDHFFYGSTGDLEAVLEYGVDGSALTVTCIAGPKSYQVPHTCLSDLVGHICVRDAGTD
jgi:hypothetical protein